MQEDESGLRASFSSRAVAEPASHLKNACRKVADESRFLTQEKVAIVCRYMTTAKIFQHGGSQAIRLPKAFRFEGTEVRIEKSGDTVVLRPVTASTFETFSEIGAYLAEKFPDAEDFPEPPTRPAAHERPAPQF